MQRVLILPLLLLCAGLPAQKAAPLIKDGMAQPVDAFSDRSEWITQDLFVEAPFDSDGNGRPDLLHVDVTRPKQTDTEGLRVPVIYATSPYFAGMAGGRSYFWNADHELGARPPTRGKAPQIRYNPRRRMISRSLVRNWLPRGFAVVHSSSPGTGLSEGCPTVGGANESQAPKAVIDWLNGRAKGYTDRDRKTEVKADWCTGKVGMTGVSYNGTLPLAAATTGVEGLEAIIPMAPNTSYYHYYRSHGLVRHPGGYMGEDIDVLYDFINSGDPKRRAWCDRTVRDKLMGRSMDRVTGDLNEFWAGRDYANQLDKVRAAVLMVHGCNDWNVMPEHTVRIYEGLKARNKTAKIYLHQGGHSGGGTPQLINRWFTKYLLGVDNGIEKGPKSYVERTGQRGQPTEYADYPHPEAEATTLHLLESGLSRGGLSLDPPAQQGRETLVDNVSVKGGDLAQAGESPHRLLYVSETLKSPVHLSGWSTLKIRLASSKPAANLSVWLVSLPWQPGRPRGERINRNIITRGWADPQNHESLTESKPLKPGEFVEFSFKLQPDDQVIPAGQQIGLMIFSSDYEFTLRPEPGTRLTVDLDATKLEIPVVGGAKALRKALGR